MLRLARVAVILNVGSKTIVETLRKNGFDIEDNPRAKVTDEQLALLEKVFKSSQELRQKVSLQHAEKTRERDEKRVRDEARKTKEKAERQARQETKAKEEPVSTVQVKVVGKIDLNPKPEPKVEKEEATPEPIQEPRVEKKEATVPEETEESETVEADVHQERETPAEEAPVAAPEPAAGPAEEPVETEELAGEEKEPEAHAEEEPAEPAEEKRDTGVPLLTKPTITGPKVLGKIDLSAINDSTRPAKKSKDARRKEYEAKRQTAAGGSGEKKKRNRIKAGRVDIASEAKKNNGDQRQGGFQRGAAGNNRQQQNQQRGGQRRDRNRLRNNQPQPAQMSDEDVARKVKETLSQLTSRKNFGNAAKYRREKRDLVRAHKEEQEGENARESKVLKLTEYVTANELASMMQVPVNKVIATCMSIGMMVSINQRMDAETIDIVADEFGFKTEYVSASVSEAVQEEEDSEDDLVPRDPIVTIMGHVDHGKTSLLDYIRNSNVIAGEAGGITQHIGAYNVELDNGRHITFLDTPGHEAFTAMRARGAQVTDIAIIIIAADDDVMPQTKEAINHAAAANVPIVFAINKIDKPTANPEKIKESLANLNYLVEDWGGKYQCQEISAKKGTGVSELLEKVLLEADMLELKANPNRRATGTVIESSLDKGRGYVATILVSNGTLRVGDNVIAGTCYGRVRDLSDERGKRVKEVRPSQAATLLGFNGAPQAGDTFHVMESEQEVREIAGKRLQLQREQSLRTSHRTTLEDLAGRINIGGVQELKLIVKGDVDGSVEALSDSLIKLSTEKVVVSVIHKAVGQITESDVSLAAASSAIIIGFEVRPSAGARREAEKEGIDIRLYSIIYDAIDDVQSAMEGLLKPIIKEEQTATLEVRQVYHISKVGMVAGAFVTSGKVHRSDKVRLVREGIVKFTGAINALKRYKDDVHEVSQDLECGISFVGFNDIAEGDVIEAFREIEVKQTL